MYDVNPLGPMMHLKALDRQATPRLRPLRTGRQNGFSLIGVKSSMIAFLRHLHAPRFPWRTLRGFLTATDYGGLGVGTLRQFAAVERFDWTQR